jgi:hypothetical protein
MNQAHVGDVRAHDVGHRDLGRSGLQPRAGLSEARVQNSLTTTYCRFTMMGEPMSLSFTGPAGMAERAGDADLVEVDGA